MEFLRNLFGSFTFGIVRLLVAVGILAAAYLFIVRPVLDTTNNAIDTAHESFQESFGRGSDFQRSMREARRSVRGANRKVEVQLHHIAHHPGAAANARRLGNCMKKAVGNVDEVQRCVERFGP